MSRIKLTCRECGIVFIERYRGQRNTKNKLCSKECSSKYMKSVSSKTMSKTNKKYASERMKKNNPMKNPKSREKMKTTLRAIGHKPKIRGGNGQGATVHQQLLASALGWDMEVVVKTEKARDSGYPTCYKLDIGNELLKVGVEADGGSHGSLERQAQDKKKDLFLESLGWKIIRFKNIEIESNLQICVEKVLLLVKEASVD